jgi:large subunit ribosomal protein L21
MYAVIRDGGREYRVSEGESFDFDLKSSLSPGDEVEFPEVLLLSRGGDDVAVGTPLVEGAKVTGTVEGHVKGQKIVAYKYRRRHGFHRKKGHRQKYTRVRITGIAG